VSRDFAHTQRNRKTKRNQKNHSKQSNLNIFKWIISGLVLGFGLAFLLYLQYGSHSESHDQKIKQPSIKQPTTQKYPAVKPPSKSDYEFWELLKNKEVQVTQDKTHHNEANTPKSYVMQCGSFKHEEMAQSLKARIALMGFSASIHQTKAKDGYAWNRVVLGPYKSKRKAESNRHRLEDNGINGCQIW